MESSERRVSGRRRRREEPLGEGWSKRVPKNQRIKQKGKKDQNGAENGSADAGSKTQPRKRRRRRRKKGSNAGTQAQTDASGEAPSGELLRVLVSHFGSDNEDALREIIVERGLTVFRTNDHQSRDQMSAWLIQKMQEKLQNCTDEDSERGYEQVEESKTHSVVQETAGPESSEEVEHNGMDDEEQTREQDVGPDADAVVNAGAAAGTEDSKEALSQRQGGAGAAAEDQEDLKAGADAEDVSQEKRKKRRRRRRKKRGASQGASAPQEEENEQRVVSRGQPEKSPSEELLPSAPVTIEDFLQSELASFDPTQDTSVMCLLKWKRQLQSDEQFPYLFDKLRAVEFVVRKIVTCDQPRSVICHREIQDLLDLTLQGSKGYHQWLLASLLELCQSVSAFSREKSGEMKRRLADLCCQIFAAHKLTIFQTGHIDQRGRLAARDRVRKSIPTPHGASESLNRKLRDIEIQHANLMAAEDDLRDQQRLVERMRPTSNPRFSRTYDEVMSQLNETLRMVSARRHKMNDQMFMIETQKKDLSDKRTKEVMPLQNQLVQMREDIESLQREQMELEKRLAAVNTRLKRVRDQENLLSEDMNKIQSGYAPQERKLKSESDETQFELKRVEREMQCYEKLQLLCDNSWKRLEEWSDTRISSYQNESDVAVHRYLQQLSSYLEAYAQVKTYLEERIKNLSSHMTSTKKKKEQLQDFFSDNADVFHYSNQEVEFYTKQIENDRRMLGAVEKTISEELTAAQDNVRHRAALFNNFLHELHARTNGALDLSEYLRQTQSHEMNGYGHHGHMQHHHPRQQHQAPQHQGSRQSPHPPHHPSHHPQQHAGHGAHAAPTLHQQGHPGGHQGMQHQVPVAHAAPHQQIPQPHQVPQAPRERSRSAQQGEERKPPMTAHSAPRQAQSASGSSSQHIPVLHMKAMMNRQLSPSRQSVAINTDQSALAQQMANAQQQRNQVYAQMQQQSQAAAAYQAQLQERQAHLIQGQAVPQMPQRSMTQRQRQARPGSRLRRG